MAWSRRTREHYCTAAYDAHYPVGKADVGNKESDYRTAADVLTEFGLDEHHYSFLSKPFSIPDLTAKVQELVTVKTR